MDIDLIELRALKPLDLDTIRASLSKTHKLVILDESTKSGGVGATISAVISEEMFDELDAPVKRLCMDDAPVPYASSMEVAVVKRGSDLIEAVIDKGAPHGEKYVFHGESDEHPEKEPGDVVIVVNEQPHKVFKRKGADILMEKDITLLESLTGVDFVINSLDGTKIRIKSAPG